MRSLLLAATAVAALSANAASAQTFSFFTIDNPGDPTFNQLLSINDKGTIAGYFGSGMQGHPNIGYEIAPPYTKFTPFMVPGSVQTQPTGLNNAGAVSGFWAPTNTGTDANFAFGSLPVSGKATIVSTVFAGSYGSPQLSQSLGINNAGNIAGFYVDANQVSHGYIYNSKTAGYKNIKVNGAVSVAATSINDNNTVAGFGVGHLGHTFGFVQNANGGVTTMFTVPGSTFTQLLGINNSGIAVGFYNDANNIAHGLYYNANTNAWVQVDWPNGAGGTVLNGVNNKNQIVGFYTDAGGNVHGMLVSVTP